MHDDLTPPPGWYPQSGDIPKMPPGHHTDQHYGPPAGPSTLYLPNLIVAMVASVGLVIGSLGPWLTFLVFDRTATDGDGMITLALGVISAAALFVVWNLGRAGGQVGWMQGLASTAVVAAAIVLVIGVIDAFEVSSRTVEFFGRTVGPQIGWGLWLVLITSVVLAVTAGIVAWQAPRVRPTFDA
jgi:hypothetical protein